MCVYIYIYNWLKTRPRAPKSLPRPPKGFSETSNKSNQEGLKRPQGPVQRLKSLHDLPKRFQKAPKMLKITKIAEIYVSQRPCPKSQNQKRRAGGVDPPWGSQLT